METAPSVKIRRQRVIVQLFGNDRWNRRMRVVPGFVKGDGSAVSMDEIGQGEFVAVMWRPLADRPPHGSGA